jgi:hypothetical protein
VTQLKRASVVDWRVHEEYASWSDVVPWQWLIGGFVVWNASTRMMIQV